MNACMAMLLCLLFLGNAAASTGSYELQLLARSFVDTHGLSQNFDFLNRQVEKLSQQLQHMSAESSQRVSLDPEAATAAIYFLQRIRAKTSGSWRHQEMHSENLDKMETNFERLSVGVSYKVGLNLAQALTLRLEVMEELYRSMMGDQTFAHDDLVALDANTQDLQWLKPALMESTRLIREAAVRRAAGEDGDGGESDVSTSATAEVKEAECWSCAPDGSMTETIAC